MKSTILLLTILTITHLGVAQSDEAAVKETIINYYWNVMYTNDERKDISEIAKGFHEDFHMYVYYKEELSVRTRESCMEILQKNRDKAKASIEPKPRKTNELTFGLIDVTGQTAVAKLIISSDGKLKYTDYLSLYKIDGEWKVISKLFTFHQI